MEIAHRRAVTESVQVLFLSLAYCNIHNTVPGIERENSYECKTIDWGRKVKVHTKWGVHLQRALANCPRFYPECARPSLIITPRASLVNKLVENSLLNSILLC